MENSLIVVEQLPIITEHLESVKEQIQERVNNALQLVCANDTAKEIKNVRAELNKEFKNFEAKRKEVKNSILLPYTNFENVYKDCISDAYTKADLELKNRIEEIEGQLKQEKEVDLRSYFAEYALSKNIDFISFENIGLNITLSASLKSLKTKIAEYIDNVVDEIGTITTMPNSEVILAEYKSNGYNLSSAISAVNDRITRIAEEKSNIEQIKKNNELEEKSIQQVTEVLGQPVIEEKEFVLKFTVYGTKEKLSELKRFLDNGGYRYE